MNTEWIGVLGTTFIVIAFMQTGEKKIRILDAVGAVAFVIYGVTIHSFSTIFLNSILIGVQIYNLLKLHKESVDEK